MQYRAYGKTGFDVSVFGMGCMRLPKIIKEDGDVEVDREKAYELIRYAAEHGVNYFDTAFGYHRQTSEEVLGEALEGKYRKQVKIATKQPFNVMKTQGDIRRNLENTLKKLRTDYIDVYLIHNIQASYWEDIKARKVIEEYEKFKEEGLIRAIGFSYHGEFPGFRSVLEYYDWDMCQVQQNLLDCDKEVTEEGIQLAGKKGTALVIMEPLRGGGLANAPTDVQKVYDQYPVKRTPAEWAFRYLYDHPQISCILSGVTTMEQLKDNIRIFSQPDVLPNCMTAEEKEIIKKAKAAYESRVTIPCTGCEYCMPCPQKVDIPGIFKKYNTGMMFENFDNAKRTYLFTKNAGESALNCVECGACEKKCPQHIDIINQLKVAHNALDGWNE
jgi:predicted aldo/keto reductase-like oxidoreductase